jgi:transcriptional regulator with PAS, ATPase and Fis domain
LLVIYFIKKFNHQYNKQVRLVDPAVLSFFSTYAWPGNIRELERVMEYAFVFVKGPIIFSRYLPESQEFSPIRHPIKSRQPRSERSRILQALTQNNQNRISRSSLWRKMKTFGLLDKSPSR